ncbi:MAG TPA: hypothetical protein PKW07_08445 [Syntrophorhabdaceae bacterium]|nr:hypothetical protein [Syntrophorhabdaceae bacterium]
MEKRACKALKNLVVIIVLLFSFTGMAYAQELTKEEATKLIIESLKNEKITDLTRYYTKNGSFYPLTWENDDINKYKILEEKGYILLKPITDTDATEINKKYGIIFTEKAEPYLIKKDDETKDRALVSLGRTDKVDITVIKQVAPKEYKAEFLIGYRLTPFGEILLGKQMILERKEDAFFEHKDNGWKIRFKTSF